MAEAKKGPISMEDFRAKRAASAASKSTGGKSKSTSTTGTSSASKTSKNLSSKPPSNSGKSMSVDDRAERVKLSMAKLAEDRKRKNEEKRAAFEERRRKQEAEEKAKKEALLKQSTASRPASGRKLPTIPTENKASHSSNSRHASPGSSARSSPNLGGKRSLSYNNIPTTISKSPSSGTLSTTRKPRSSSTLGKSSSTHDLSTTARRGSTSSLPKSSSASTTSASTRPSRPLSMVASTAPSSSNSTTSITKSKSPSTTNLSTKQIPKSLSTSALNTKAANPTHKKEKKEQPHKAGHQDLEAAKLALAEGRRKAREKAEQQAKLDREKAEQERIKREEEERRQAEELAKEEERQRQLAEMLRIQEEERLKVLMEEKEKRDQEEKERLEKEKKIKEEEKRQREENEKKAREEAERRAIEEEERLRKEEIERQERKKRVEEIMSRTRTSTPGDTSLSKRFSLPEGMVLNNSTSDNNEPSNEDTKKKVSEILQKFKGRSTSSNNIAESADAVEEKSAEESDNKDDNENQVESTDNSEKTQVETNGEKHHTEYRKPTTEEILAMYMPTVETTVEDEAPPHTDDVPTISLNDETDSILCNVEDSFDVTRTELISDTPQEDNVTNGNGVHNGTDSGDSSMEALSGQFSGLDLSEEKPKVKEFLVSENGADLLHETAPCNGELNGYNMHLQESITRVEETRNEHKIAEEEVWSTTELIMKAKEDAVKDALESSGIVPDGDEDEDGEEGQLWKVVEGHMHLSEVL